MPYHVTLQSQVPIILRDGLIPQTGPRAEALGEGENGIYLFKELDDVGNALSNWLFDEFAEDEKLALLEVIVPLGARTLPTTAEYELVVADPIPAQYIKVLYDDLDEVNLWCRIVEIMARCTVVSSRGILKIITGK